MADAARVTARTGTASVRFTVEVEADDGGPTFTSTGEGVVDFAATRAALTLTVADRDPLEVVLVGDQAFHRTEPGAPKPWIAMPPSTMAAPFLGVGGPGGHALAALPLLGDERLLDGVRRAGIDEVAGVRTDKYVGTLDVDVRGRGNDLPPPFMRFLPSSLEVWVSDDGLVRRYRTRVVTAMDEHITYRMLVSLDLVAFGAPVRIEPPPPDQVQAPAA